MAIRQEEWSPIALDDQKRIEAAAALGSSKEKKRLLETSAPIDKGPSPQEKINAAYRVGLTRKDSLQTAHNEREETDREVLTRTLEQTKKHRVRHKPELEIVENGSSSRISEETRKYQEVLSLLRKGEILTDAERQEYIDRANAKFTELSGIYKRKAGKGKIGWEAFARVEIEAGDPEGFAATLGEWRLLKQINGFDRGHEIYKDLVLEDTDEETVVEPPPLPTIEDAKRKINRADLADIHEMQDEAIQKLDGILKNVIEHLKTMPGGISEFFNTGKWQLWEDMFQGDLQELSDAKEEIIRTDCIQRVTPEAQKVIDALLKEKGHSKMARKILLGILAGLVATVVGMNVAYRENSLPIKPDDSGKTSEIIPGQGTQEASAGGLPPNPDEGTLTKKDVKKVGTPKVKRDGKRTLTPETVAGLKDTEKNLQVGVHFKGPKPDDIYVAALPLKPSNMRDVIGTPWKITPKGISNTGKGETPGVEYTVGPVDKEHK